MYLFFLISLCQYGLMHGYFTLWFLVQHYLSYCGVQIVPALAGGEMVMYPFDILPSLYSFIYLSAFLLSGTTRLRGLIIKFPSWLCLKTTLILFSPGWCGSEDWARACEPKGHRFDPQSGHMPGLQVRFPVGGMWKATTHWFFSPSPSPSFPSL